jgi:hypothetical protein
VLALILHIQTTGYKIREGTADAAAKRKAWEEARKVFNEHAKSDGVNYEWSLEQVKALYNAKKSKFQEWRVKAAAWKSGAENYWISGEGKGKKPYYYDAFDRLLGERAATAPPTELEVGGSAKVVKKSKVRVRSGSRARCLTHARGTQGKAAAAGVGGEQGTEARLLGGEGADGDDGDDVLFVGDSPLPTAPIRNTTGEGEGEEADADRQARRKAKAAKRAQVAGKAKAQAEDLKKEEKRRRRAEKEEDAQLMAGALANAFGPVFADLSKTIKHAAASLAAPGGKRRSEGDSTRKSRRRAEEEDEEEDEDTE